MNLPSFLWLWRIAAWSMGGVLLVYVAQAVSGFGLHRGHMATGPWLRRGHIFLGWLLVRLVLLLLGIGIVGTLGHFGSLGHSVHLGFGLGVTLLVLLSAASASQIHPQRPWARRLHLTMNALLLVGLMGVLASGWQVVQKYLP